MARSLGLTLVASSLLATLLGCGSSTNTSTTTGAGASTTDSNGGTGGTGGGTDGSGGSGGGGNGEICGNGLDDNGDGKVDEGCSCTPGTAQPCYGGPVAQAGIGACVKGQQQCSGQGEFGAWGDCTGWADKKAETCNGADDDCNGTVDDGLGQQSCGDGACKNTVPNCMDGKPVTCTPLQPGNGSCQCSDGAVQNCYDGPAGTNGFGQCHPGTQTCAGGAWGGCTGEVVPKPETCDDTDEDCNGIVDDVAGLGMACSTGKPGVCDAGKMGCEAGQVTCVQNVQPSAEKCNGADDDCNGAVDDGLGQLTCGQGACQNSVPACAGGQPQMCVPLQPGMGACMCIDGATEPCYDGPQGTLGVGICKAGTSTCSNGAWGACVGEVLPKAPQCNGGDNDCNGVADNGGAATGTCAASVQPVPLVCSAQDLMINTVGKQKVVFQSTGADQSFLVPAGVTSIRVKAWGAGGGSSSFAPAGKGGGAGFVTAQIAVIPGETLTIVVGAGGKDAFQQGIGNAPYGGGGLGGYFGSNGGGRSAIRRAMNELLTAGGGGGGGTANGPGPAGFGGAGGLPGADGSDSVPNDASYGTHGTGATQQCGGTGGVTFGCGCSDYQNGAGSGGLQFTGGSTIQSAPGQGSGGGGAGWFGGGSGGGDCGGNTGGGGGGGSCFALPAEGCVVSGMGAAPANTADPDYAFSAGLGGSAGGAGSGGLVVLFY